MASGRLLDLGRLKGTVKAVLENRFPAAFVLLARLNDRFLSREGEPEQALLPLLCAPSEVAVDVGANHGSYTAALARLATRVVAVEANPGLASILRRRMAREVRAGRVVVVEAALSDEPGTAELFVPRGASALASVEAHAAGGEGDTIRVRRETLDGLSLARTGFVKIDVEGHEEAVVAGGLGTIARDRPTILVEAEERHHPGSLAAIQERLEALGYRGFFLLGGRLRPIAEFDPAIMQLRSALNEAGTHRREGSIYINNFLFVARDGVLRALSKEGLLLPA